MLHIERLRTALVLATAARGRVSGENNIMLEIYEHNVRALSKSNCLHRPEEHQIMCACVYSSVGVYVASGSRHVTLSIVCVRMHCVPVTLEMHKSV